MNMSAQDQHTMVIARELPDGTQEWVCPTCVRRILMQWPPHYKRTVLEIGDENAAHSGGMGGLQMGQANIVSPKQEETFPGESLDLPVAPAEENDPYLMPWIEWLDAQNF
ncbi:MAG: hypothetical protein IH586_20100 [Anaerolineaceae bacterium]|nr:hypothetical protein [Anaerolineaceae bacterium]